MNARQAGCLTVMLLSLCCTPFVLSEELVKSKSLEASSDKIYAAAEKVFERHFQEIEQRDPVDEKSEFFLFATGKPGNGISRKVLSSPSLLLPFVLARLSHAQDHHC